ncbi:MAG: hypothetical protein IKE75_02060 [Bacilli bacterium]|nr:hypothetical protein [Bacilli bacterium]
MNEDINALDEIHKGACMGMNAIDDILDKVHDKSFKDELEKEYNAYKDISKRIEDIYPKYNEGKPHETSSVNKIMTEMMLDMKTMNDTSNSKIAEILLQGVNMGIIEGRKILNKKSLNEEVNEIVLEYVTMQEEAVNTLKDYL